MIVPPVTTISRLRRARRSSRGFFAVTIISSHFSFFNRTGDITASCQMHMHVDQTGQGIMSVKINDCIIMKISCVRYDVRNFSFLYQNTEPFLYLHIVILTIQ